ncbi:MAG: dephospho-CoA kinase [Anaerolineales bacterium]|nr:dephospho-CoA kinase [Anaerolineales bacterium]
MGAWPGKYVIGLTGNIATGKSVVRKMLEHLGAYGIDADALGHRAIAPDAPGYQPVVDIFGKWILDGNGYVDRSRLARIAFSDPQALALLEKIVHPLVREAVDLLVRRSRYRVVVLEAIKLLEGELREKCDAIWVTYAPREVQLERLVQKRGMSEEIARQRINAQPTQEQKLAAANVVITNEGSFEDAWVQVVAAWVETVPLPKTAPLIARPVPEGDIVVERARPRQAGHIAAFINRLSSDDQHLNREDIMAAFGEKAYLLLKRGTRIVGLVGWQVENLVARTADVFLEPGLSLEESMRLLLAEVEQASRELQCEASLLFLSSDFASHRALWKELGYEPRSIQSLGVRAWQEAAIETMPSGSAMFFKQLRKDRVLQPI